MWYGRKLVRLAHVDLMPGWPRRCAHMGCIRTCVGARGGRYTVGSYSGRLTPASYSFAVVLSSSQGRGRARPGHDPDRNHDANTAKEY
jgi:hypothetical protein